MNINNLLVTSLLLLAPSFAFGQEEIDENTADDITVSDTTIMGIKVKQRSAGWDYYEPERGFYQKAYVDKGDPRFMISNEDETFQFGIGGRLRATAFCDFNGAVDHNRFSTWDIAVPTDHATHFGVNVASTNIFFKSRLKLGKHKLISYIELGSNEKSEVTIGKAYLSYAGLSIGKTYSFFMDLAAGVQTVDLRGPNTSVGRTHPLIGYSSFLGKHWVLDVAAENPDLEIGNHTALGIVSEHQSMPDFTTRVAYKGDWGHLQLSGLIRSLCYYSADEAFETFTASTPTSSKHELGFGVSLSGKIKFSPKFFFTFQSIYGKGIGQYINDFSGQKIDLVPTRANSGTEKQYYKMRALPMYGGYVAAQYNITDKLVTSAVCGKLRADFHKVENMEWAKGNVFDYLSDIKTYDYRGSTYFAVNMFYHISNYCTFGAEYLHGIRSQRERDASTMKLTGDTSHGHANRIDMMFAYTF